MSCCPGSADPLPLGPRLHESRIRPIIRPRAGYRSAWGDDRQPSNASEGRLADAANLTDAERAKLEQRRDRLMKLMKDGGDGDDLDAEDRADLVQEWNRIDQLLNRR
jgi:hypothetical protein